MPRTSPDWIPKQQRKTLQCKDCKKRLPPSEFVSEGSDKNGYKRFSSRCKPCYNVYMKVQWKSKQPGYTFPKKEEIMALVASAKQRCVVCGYSKCKAALDFHHKSGKKEAGVAKLMGSYASLKRIEAEIQKCVVLCCRCHREHHAGILEL